ncbi:hypothetical protein M3Y99_00918900 [Aphelenchoides fujianensis]|nr:hypothetical protein M3Y99_00918900 [Aphelenchoides fujianensis]
MKRESSASQDDQTRAATVEKRPRVVQIAAEIKPPARPTAKPKGPKFRSSQVAAPFFRHYARLNRWTPLYPLALARKFAVGLRQHLDRSASTLRVTRNWRFVNASCSWAFDALNPEGHFETAELEAALCLLRPKLPAGLFRRLVVDSWLLGSSTIPKHFVDALIGIRELHLPDLQATVCPNLQLLLVKMAPRLRKLTCPRDYLNDRDVAPMLLEEFVDCQLLPEGKKKEKVNFDRLLVHKIRRIQLAASVSRTQETSCKFGSNCRVQPAVQQLIVTLCPDTAMSARFFEFMPSLQLVGFVWSSESLPPKFMDVTQVERALGVIEGFGADVLRERPQLQRLAFDFRLAEVNANGAQLESLEAISCLPFFEHKRARIVEVTADVAAIFGGVSASSNKRVLIWEPHDKAIVFIHLLPLTLAVH